MGSTETEKYTLRDLVRNNCVCCAENKACDICKIDKQVALAVKEWLEKTRQNWKGNNLIAESEHETIDWAIDELLEDLTV